MQFIENCFNVIWTTTPWTIPANQALNMNPELEYGLYDVGDRLLILGTSRRRPPRPSASRAPRPTR